MKEKEFSLINLDRASANKLLKYYMFPEFTKIPNVPFHKSLIEQTKKMIGQSITSTMALVSQSMVVFEQFYPRIRTLPVVPGILVTSAIIKHAYCGSNYMITGLKNDIHITNIPYQNETGQTIEALHFLMNTCINNFQKSGFPTFQNLPEFQLGL